MSEIQEGLSQGPLTVEKPTITPEVMRNKLNRIQELRANIKKVHSSKDVMKANKRLRKKDITQYIEDERMVREFLREPYNENEVGFYLPFSYLKDFVSSLGIPNMLKIIRRALGKDKFAKPKLRRILDYGLQLSLSNKTNLHTDFVVEILNRGNGSLSIDIPAIDFLVDDYQYDRNNPEQHKQLQESVQEAFQTLIQRNISELQ